MMAKLGARQQRFVEQYLIDLNGTQAAIRAGYSKRSASVIAAENLAKPNIADAIAEAIQKRADEAEIDAAWVLEKAKLLFSEAMDANDRSNANRTLELIGKHIDVMAFKERTELSGPNGGPIQTQNMEPLTDEALEAIVAGDGD